MKKTVKPFLMLCLIISAVFSHAHNVAVTESMKANDNFPIEITANSSHSGSDRSSSIQATLDGHWLTVVFTENLGTVQINITDDHGNRVEMLQMFTPNGYSAYIYDTGSYVITFTLPNGDEYYGEFEVTE